MTIIDHSKIQAMHEREKSRYLAERPKSRALLERAKASLLSGVPMTWMANAPCALPLFLKEANGARITDADGHRYVDMCLGGSAAITGHSPAPVADAIARQAYKGLTTILPTEDSIWVGEELTHRFGLPYWQIYMTATDANKFAIRVARHVTKRSLVLVFDGCYHGSLDESLVSIQYGSARVMGMDVIGPLPNPASRVIHFNDLGTLETALSSEDVACVLTEPALTNSGIIFPEPGYHEALQEMTRRFGTLLIIDETHTITGGPGGLTRKWNLEPDIFTMGKPIGGGLPAAVMGVTQEVAEKLSIGSKFTVGLGGTLSANPLQIAAIRATLENVLTESAYDRMISITDGIADFMDKKIEDANLPWHVSRLGCRLEYGFSRIPPKNAAEFESSYDEDLFSLIILYFANRGIWLTPVHCTVLVSAATTVEDANLFNKLFRELVDELVNK